ncbi:MAG: hypothetical protein Q8O88_02640 [bacterium]|nr:hypothetical protein [bacterium]
MKITHILISGLLTLLISCEKTDPSKIEFDGQTFELPIKVKKAKEKLKLHYGYYSGFYNGNVDDTSIETQLKDYPLFMGSDNDKEESYFNNYFVGVTFFKEDKTIEQFKNDFEKQYDKKFKTKTKDFGVTRTLPPFNMTFHYIKTDEGLYVALKEIDRKPDNKKYISISFYKGISESELGKYLEYVL